MENKNEPLIYKGYAINQVFDYKNLRGDYEVFPPDSEKGYIAPNQTLEAVLNDIDEKLAEA